MLKKDFQIKGKTEHRASLEASKRKNETRNREACAGTEGA